MNFHVHKRTVIAAIGALFVVIIVLGVAFVDTYKKVAPGRFITPERLSSVGREHTVLGINDVSTISSWMTFDYINDVFALPPEYLRSTLGINDARYPKLMLSRYAKDISVDTEMLTTHVQNSVKDYFKSQQSR